MSFSTLSRSGTWVTRGLWDPNKTYHIEDIVIWLNVEWQSLIPNNKGNQPDISPAAWVEINPPSSPFVSIMSFGAHFDTLISSKAFVNDGTHSLNNSTVFLTDYLFIASDIGKSIIVTDGGQTGTVVVTTISNVVSGNAILTSPWTGGAITNGTVVWGHDDSAAYLAGITFMYNNYQHGGGTLILPAGNSLVLSQSVLNTVNQWTLGIFGQGIGPTTIFVANSSGWIAINNISRGAQCTIRDFDVLACVQGAGVGFAWRVQGIGGNQQQTFWADHVLFNSLIPTVGYFRNALDVTGAFRPELRDVFVNARFGPNVSGTLNDDGGSFATDIGICLDGCYTPHLLNCDVWNCVRGYQMMVEAGTQGMYMENCQAVSCREGVWVESPDVEPQAAVIGGHMNNRDLNIGAYQRKLTKNMGTLHYNNYLTANVATTINQVGGIGVGDSTVTLTSVTGWNTAGGMATIDSECMTYTGIVGNQLQGLVRGAYGTVAAVHANGATVYPNGMTATTAIVNTGAITPGTAIPVVNTAGMPRIGAVLLGSEWWTYDNLHQYIYASGTVTGGTYTISFTWNGTPFTTAPIAWNAGQTTVAAAMQTAAPAIPSNQIVGGRGQLPGQPTTIAAMYGVTSVGPLIVTSINSASLTGGGTYQVSGSTYQTNLYNLSRAAFGTVDPGANYPAGTAVTASVSDILIAGTSYGVNVEDCQYHGAGNANSTALRHCLQVQDSSHDVTQSDNWFHASGAVCAAIDGTASSCYITDNKYSSFNITPPIPLLNGAADTSFKSARRRHLLANLSAVQLFTTGVVATVANWQVVEDTDGFLTSGSTVTIPSNAGIKRVRVTCCLGWATNAGGGDRRLRIGHNGNFSTPGGADNWAPGSVTDQNTHQLAVSGILDVVGGDTIAIQAEQTVGGNLNLNASATTFLEVEVLEG